MDFSKLKNKLLILLCVFVVLFPFCLVSFSFADTEDPIIDIKNDTTMSQDGTLKNVTGFTTYFLTIEDGYYYDILLTSSGTTPSDNGIRIGYTNSQDYGADVYNYAIVNGSYHVIINSNDFDYFYFDFGNLAYGVSTSYTINKYKLSNMNNAVDNLVENVGPNAIWSIFDISINYIFIVVLAAFGIFIIGLVIRKITKGKEGF